MSKYECEMFGHFNYDDSLTYQDLLDMETWIVGQVQWLLDEHNAAHIDFSPLGDELMVQCAFDAYDTDLFHSLCAKISHVLPSQMTGRLLFVDKHMASLHIFYMTHEEWKESPLLIPSAREALAPAPPASKKAPKSKKS